ncbi:MAG: cupin domain-containing protein [Geminicoccaceae bacterium]|nr:cupin domain-containing protein [Geminicoccaceae bacterium]
MREERDVRFDESIGAHVGRSKPVEKAEIEGRVWRMKALEPEPDAFIDTRVPGFRRVLFGALGTGTAEEKITKAVKGAEHFHVDYVKAAPGEGVALHSHDTEEVFIAMTGRWRISVGTGGEHEIELDTFDGISVPSGVMRSFTNIGDEEAMLMAILGGKTPGHVVWSEAVVEKLRRGIAA